MCTSISTKSLAAPPNAVTEQLGMDTIDVLLASHFFLASQDVDNNFWTDDLSDVKIVPLYNVTGAITSYYVELTGCTGYAVINNNIENPAAIEFGEGVQPLIREILDNVENPYIVYNSPTSLYNIGSELPICLSDCWLRA